MSSRIESGLNNPARAFISLGRTAWTRFAEHCTEQGQPDYSMITPVRDEKPRWLC
jgi:hypothetical protein